MVFALIYFILFLETPYLFYLIIYIAHDRSKLRNIIHVVEPNTFETNFDNDDDNDIGSFSYIG